MVSLEVKFVLNTFLDFDFDIAIVVNIDIATVIDTTADINIAIAIATNNLIDICYLYFVETISLFHNVLLALECNFVPIFHDDSVEHNCVAFASNCRSLEPIKQTE